MPKAKVLELADALSLNEPEIRQLLEASMTSVAPYWYLPFPKNPFFIGRSEELHALHNHLLACADTAMPIFALQGMGGIGKTQVAIEYAYRYAFEYTALLWIDAQTPESLLVSLQHIAQVLQLPARLETNPQQLIEAVQYWLARHTQWLLIWDHLEDLDMI
ncbi:hypothetical protein KSF_100420 [Reticulibacter mediterranei]|uniref:NB-ARC domain-containing protein n=1 Tax=Reticulibacter mediterranei TaxID=2778369 RepID=A0A8J3IY01_9CHLR|nr:ATP-binding protein [Reticulibacter mediterranei]GHO99994.1 hypothetical protein KSF_100420 [Reticulibacter mediterranei]